MNYLLFEVLLVSACSMSDMQDLFGMAQVLHGTYHCMITLQPSPAQEYQLFAECWVKTLISCPSEMDVFPKQGR
jgi:hypothetical protein